MSRLELHHYESLIAVIEAGGITAAAQQLMVSQSAVSHRLAEAERRLGYRLFDRRPARPVRPTPAAATLYQAAKRVLPELQRAESDFLRAEGRHKDIIRLGVGSYDCYHWLPGFHAFAAEYLPDCLFELVVVTDAPATQLNSGAVDVILAVGQPEGRHVSEPLFDDELVLITHPDHPAAALKHIEPEMLENEVYFTYSRTPAPGFEYDRFLRPAQVTPRTTIVIEQTNAIAEMVASGAGVAILSGWAVSPWLSSHKVSAVACGANGLTLEWRSLVRTGTTEASPEIAARDAITTWLQQSAAGSATPWSR